MNRDDLKKEIKKLLKGEFKSKLQETTGTGAVAGYQTPFAFSSRKNSEGNTEVATKSLPGYKIAPKTKPNNRGNINEAADYNVKSDYDAFMAKLKNTNFALENEIKTKLNKQLAGKKVMLHGSKGYKQFKKDYEIDVTSAKIEDYYGNFEVVLVGSDGKEYFVDRDYKVKIISGSTAAPTAQPPTEAPPAAQKPEEKPAAPPAQAPVKPETQPAKTDLSKELKK
jgi:hypothetical protein